METKCIFSCQSCLLLKSYKKRIDIQSNMIKSYRRDSDHYFHLWLEQLEISDKLRKWLCIDSIMLIVLSLWMLVLSLFGV